MLSTGVMPSPHGRLLGAEGEGKTKEAANWGGLFVLIGCSSALLGNVPTEATNK